MPFKVYSVIINIGNKILAMNLNKMNWCVKNKKQKNSGDIIECRTEQTQPTQPFTDQWASIGSHLIRTTLYTDMPQVLYIMIVFTNHHWLSVPQAGQKHCMKYT